MTEESNPQTPIQLPEDMKRLLWVLFGVLGLSTLAISAYAAAIAIQILKSGTFPDGANVSFLAVIAATFGVLITGVFVFMTFRIDRGAVIEARRTAQKEADRLLQDAKKDAVTAAREAIEGDKQKILKHAKAKASELANGAQETAMKHAEVRANELVQAAKRSHEDFAVTIANELRTRTTDRLRLRNRNVGADIEVLIREDGRA